MNQLIAIWHDRKILPGQEWGREIDKNLDHANIDLLLVSPDFLASHYAYGREMVRALERQLNPAQPTVIPIILRPCDWRTAPLVRCRPFQTPGARCPCGPIATRHGLISRKDCGDSSLAKAYALDLEIRPSNLSHSIGFAGGLQVFRVLRP